MKGITVSGMHLAFVRTKSRLYSAFAWNFFLIISWKNLGTIWIKYNWNPEFICLFARHLSIAINNRSFFLIKSKWNLAFSFVKRLLQSHSPNVVAPLKMDPTVPPSGALFRGGEKPRAVPLCSALLLSICKQTNGRVDGWMNVSLPSIPFAPHRVLIALQAVKLSVFMQSGCARRRPTLPPSLLALSSLVFNSFYTSAHVEDALK